MRSAVAQGEAARLPLTLIAQAIPKLRRDDLEALAERLIDRLDQVDGDPDLEDSDPAEDDDGGYCEADDDRGTKVPTVARACIAGSIPAGWLPR